MKDPITPPMMPILDKPKLAIPPAINVQKNIQSARQPAAAEHRRDELRRM